MASLRYFHFSGLGDGIPGALRGQGEWGCMSPIIMSIGPLVWGPWGLVWPREGGCTPPPLFYKFGPGDGVPGTLTGLGRGAVHPPPSYYPIGPRGLVPGGRIQKIIGLVATLFSRDPAGVPLDSCGIAKKQAKQFFYYSASGGFLWNPSTRARATGYHYPAPIYIVFLLLFRTGEQVPDSCNGCRNMIFHVADSQSERSLWQLIKWLHFCPKVNQIALV